MGIGKDILVHLGKGIAKGVAVDVGVSAFDKVSERSKKKSEKKIKKFLSDDPTHVHLVVINPRDTFRKQYSVYDKDLNVKYNIKGKLVSLSHHLTITDANGEKLATIKEKLISLRSPLSKDSDPRDFIIEIGGEKIGKIKSVGDSLSRKFEICFNDWAIQGSVTGLRYEVRAGDEIILKVTEKPGLELFSGQKYYFLDITNPENELIGLAIATTLDVALTTKG